MATSVIDSDLSRASAAAPPRPRWRRILGLGTVLVMVTGVLSSPWWGPRALASLDYFHARRVVIEGVRYSRASELVALLQVDTLQSVWQPMGPLVERVAAHPMVASVTVERRLPGELLVRVVERQPAALVPSDGRLVPADGAGHRLPIDPARVPLDLPIAASADSALLSVLDALRQSDPGLSARITQASRIGEDELRFELGTLIVRTTPDVTVARFRDILPVEADLARHSMRAVELDLRFRDQVIARQP